MLIFAGTRMAICDDIPLENVAALKSNILRATAETHQEFLSDGQLDVPAIETFLRGLAGSERAARSRGDLNLLKCRVCRAPLGRPPFWGGYSAHFSTQNPHAKRHTRDI